MPSSAVIGHTELATCPACGQRLPGPTYPADHCGECGVYVGAMGNRIYVGDRLIAVRCSGCMSAALERFSEATHAPAS